MLKARSGSVIGARGGGRPRRLHCLAGGLPIDASGFSCGPHSGCMSALAKHRHCSMPTSTQRKFGKRSAPTSSLRLKRPGQLRETSQNRMSFRDKLRKSQYLLCSKYWDSIEYGGPDGTQFNQGPSRWGSMQSYGCFPQIWSSTGDRPRSCLQSSPSVSSKRPVFG